MYLSSCALDLLLEKIPWFFYNKYKHRLSFRGKILLAIISCIFTTILLPVAVIATAFFIIFSPVIIVGYVLAALLYFKVRSDHENYPNKKKNK